MAWILPWVDYKKEQIVRNIHNNDCGSMILKLIACCTWLFLNHGSGFRGVGIQFGCHNGENCVWFWKTRSKMLSDIFRKNLYYVVLDSFWRVSCISFGRYCFKTSSYSDIASSIAKEIAKKHGSPSFFKKEEEREREQEIERVRILLNFLFKAHSKLRSVAFGSLYPLRSCMQGWISPYWRRLLHRKIDKLSSMAC